MYGQSKYVCNYLAFCLLSGVLLTWLHLHKRYQIIQFHTLPDFVIFAGLIPKLFGAKLVLDMHEVMPEFYMTKFGVSPDHVLVKVLNYLELVSVRFADATIVVTDAIRRLVERRCRPKRPLCVVMNTLDEYLVASPQKAACRKDDKFVLMYHGALTPMYGVDIAIRAMPRIKTIIQGALLWIFGKEDEAEELKRIVNDIGMQDAVRFNGERDQAEMLNLISLADVGLVPIRRSEERRVGKEC
jgi:glycosyltransferase involved in cell wall biosynthesis